MMKSYKVLVKRNLLLILLLFKNIFLAIHHYATAFQKVFLSLVSKASPDLPDCVSETSPTHKET